MELQEQEYQQQQKKYNLKQIKIMLKYDLYELALQNVGSLQFNQNYCQWFDDKIHITIPYQYVTSIGTQSLTILLLIDQNNNCLEDNDCDYNEDNNDNDQNNKNDNDHQNNKGQSQNKIQPQIFRMIRKKQGDCNYNLIGNNLQVYIGLSYYNKTVLNQIYQLLSGYIGEIEDNKSQYQEDDEMQQMISINNIVQNYEKSTQ